MYSSSSRAYRTQSQLRVMAARSVWFLQELEGLVGLVSFVYTLLAFLLACCMLPLFLACYLVVTGCRRMWLRLLERRSPQLKFVRNTSLRSAIDTSRNQGVITVLLTVRGRCDKELLRTRLLEHIVERRREDGRLVFPHLRTPLTKCWGRYAWDNPCSFHIDNHLVAGAPLFRGRPVTDQNIQEYVSVIVSKYLPPDISPWQLTVIPSLSGPDEKYFVLIRIHHLLMSEEGLGLGDLLRLSPESPSLWRTPLGEDDENPVQEVQPSQHSMPGFFQVPVAIPKLCNAIRVTLINLWNQFILSCDPLENPSVLKSDPYLSTSVSVLIITCAAIIRDLFRYSKYTNDSCMNIASNIFMIIQNQAKKRQCKFSFIIQGVLNSLHPLNVIATSITWLWWVGITVLLRLPILLFREVLLLAFKRGVTPGTATDVVCAWCALVRSSLREVWYVWKVLYTAPRITIEELLRSHQGQSHQLQTVSLCGRKVVAWSDPVPQALVRKIQSATGSSCSDIVMSATSRALREYFRQLGFAVPDAVLATARYLPLEGLMNPSQGCATGEGWLCLPLPTRTTLGDDDDPLAGLRKLQDAVARASRRQTALQLASMWPRQDCLITQLLPSFVVRLLINYLSRSYSVTLTDVAPHPPEEACRRLLWGQEVESVIYWRPPQANVSLSLSVMTYGNTVRLGVMSDAQLSPQHIMLASGFGQQLHELAMAAGVPRERGLPA